MEPTSSIPDWTYYLGNNLLNVRISSPYDTPPQADAQNAITGIPSTSLNTNGVMVGTAGISVDQVNRRILVNDGSNNRIGIGNV